MGMVFSAVSRADVGAVNKRAAFCRGVDHRRVVKIKIVAVAFAVVVRHREMVVMFMFSIKGECFGTF